jgi:hypothetical protein
MVRTTKKMTALLRLRQQAMMAWTLVCARNGWKILLAKRKLEKTYGCLLTPRLSVVML